jgi:hypothetical protein
MSGLTDTTPEAERVLREAQRRIPFARRWRQIGEMYHLGRVFHAAGYRERHPGATEAEIAEAWRREMLGAHGVHPQREARMSTPEEALQVVEEVISTLNRLGIPYALGGSWASSVHGERRFTQDADITVEPFPGQEGAFLAAFVEDYYISPQAIADALRLRSWFNIIHLPTGFKVDLFVRKDRPFEMSVLQRRRSHRLSDGAGGAVFVMAPEDIVLFKLEWYRIGGEQSERQWNDILGVLKVQAGSLDMGYLEQWATQLKVDDLLARARQESGL